MCLKEGKSIITTDNSPISLIGYWKFDDNHGVDSSGNKNNIYPVP